MYNELKSKKNKLLIQQILKNITYEINEEMKTIEEVSDEDLFDFLWELQNKVNKIEDLLKGV